MRVYGPREAKQFVVALYPRKPGEPEPKVESLANGKLTKLTLPDQTHWILLSRESVTVTDGDVKVTGTAAVVKRWNGGKARVTLLAEGAARCGELRVESKEPVTKER